MTTQVLNGVRNFYGPRSAEDKLPALIKTEGYTKEMVVDFNFDDLPTYSADGSMVLEIPADSLILSARLHVKTAGVGGTSLAMGLYTSAGVEIDLDGFVTAAAGAAANLTEDAWLIGGGALVGATIGATAGQIVVTEAGTFTSGAYRLIVEYVQPLS
jgi:hypothetical protein